ncbi:secreted protein [Ophiostoma piceae UAMH 11346]|uniref:Secreted protein n=1 Tax=Ophiostoma piceae (strain UAMH 11346) TaxID=1262450 RepID=S3C1L8_OPHP1|nr:secreted protein [Ophiostoma piceae UAMH 11346]
MASLVRRLFRRKKPAPLVCSITLDDGGNPLADDPHHHHTGACFVDFEPLAIVELFQSQGCVSCPPAVPNVHKATSESPNRLLLTFNVTVFDHLGWKDTFARNSWDQRQRAYVKRWQRNTLFTPQVVVNGLTDTSGAQGVDEVNEAVIKARMEMRLPWHIYLDANDTEVRIDSDAPTPGFTPEPAPAYTDDAYGESGYTPPAQTQVPPVPLVHDIMIAVYHATDESVKIGKGPNKGKKLVHRNVVTDVIKLGEWQGGDKTVSLPMARSAMQRDTKAVAFVQAGPGGPVIAATKI